MNHFLASARRAYGEFEQQAGTMKSKRGIARETTGRNYGRIYAYDEYLKILNEGTEPVV